MGWELIINSIETKHLLESVYTCLHEREMKGKKSIIIFIIFSWIYNESFAITENKLLYYISARVVRCVEVSLWRHTILWNMWKNGSFPLFLCSETGHIVVTKIQACIWTSEIVNFLKVSLPFKSLLWNL